MEQLSSNHRAILPLLQEIPLSKELIKEFGMLQQELAVHFPNATSIFCMKQSAQPYKEGYFNITIGQQLKFNDKSLTAGGLGGSIQG